ncbi:CheR family methyltransferase [Teredinibacter haidensis]|uniref:CheR family methyltransferase n=1 Tax=Teredinibacter haidensis TaxID=2731755 RepID=UPI000948D3B7|nr:protein-glutamate O-methyltransferase CheR [Teredinibacter haidensis]
MSAIEDFSGREFPMSDRNFDKIKDVAYSLTGISLSNHKKNMVYGRLARRLRRLQLGSFDQYCSLISESKSHEHVEFVNAITTNLTSFFRENHHFEYLVDTLLPEVVKHKKEKRLRVWSAGCSTGEEPYSIAMVLKSYSGLNSWDVKVLATDLDSNVVSKGKHGVYPVERAESIPHNYRRYLSVNNETEKVKVKKVIQEMITFKQLNLLHAWPMKGPFDLIFCRNVVIYFDSDTQRNLFDRYANILVPEGRLFIGHSENLHNISGRFSSLGKTIYQLS